MSTVAIVGTGFMARTHLERYAAMDVEVLGIASRSGPVEFVREQSLDTSVYRDVKRMCDELDPDFVDVCTPTDTHRVFVEIAAEAGCDVFVEKPIAGSLKDAQAISETIERTGVMCMVGHVLRFFPEYKRTKAIVDDGGVGVPGIVRARRLSPFPDWGSNDWYADRDRSGGVFLDLAIHDFDVLRWMFGEVSHVFARQQTRGGKEHGFVTLRFETDAVAYVEASWAQPASRELTMQFEVAGDDGVISFDSTDTSPFREYSDDAVSTENTVTRDGYRRQLEHFVECLSTETEPAVTIDDAISALRLSLAAELSAQNGLPVSPAEVQP